MHLKCNLNASNCHYGCTRWGGLKLDSAITEIRAKVTTDFSDSRVSLMPNALYRLAIKSRLNPLLQVLENATDVKVPFWIIPTLRWDAETFGKGLALDLVFLNFSVSASCYRLSLLSVDWFWMWLPLALACFCFGFPVKMLLLVKLETLIFLQSHTYGTLRSVLMGSINNILSVCMDWI